VLLEKTQFGNQFKLFKLNPAGNSAGFAAPATQQV
jgi:hypothetical protein